MAPPKSKTWCFTLNHPETSPDGEIKQHWRTSPEAVKLLDLECQLLIIGFEVGESGTPHLQGFVTFKYSKTLTAMKKINARAHWEIARAEEQAANYALKDGDYEKKDYRKQGARVDIRLAIDTLRAHGLKRVKRDHPMEFLKYPSGFAALDVLNEEERDVAPDVVWLWGNTGTGKSHFANNIYPGRTRWWSGKDLRWWQGYRGEDIVILDDFRKDFCKFHELLRILDKYPYKVEVKGSHRELNSKMIIITTIEPPLVMYADQGERLDQLTRRITKIIKATKSGDSWSLTNDPFLNKPYKHETALSAPTREPNAVEATAPLGSHSAAEPRIEQVSLAHEPTPTPIDTPSQQEHENGGPLADQDTEPQEVRSARGGLSLAGINTNVFWEEELARDDEQTFFNVPEGL